MAYKHLVYSQFINTGSFTQFTKWLINVRSWDHEAQLKFTRFLLTSKKWWLPLSYWC